MTSQGELEHSRQGVFRWFVLRVAAEEEVSGQVLSLWNELEAGDPKGLQASNVGAWHSETNVLARLPVLRRLVLDAAAWCEWSDADATGSRPRALDVAAPVESWINAARQGGRNATHSHPGFRWSGVYYARVGSSGGRLALEPNAPSDYVFTADELTRFVPRRQAAPPTATLQPQPGLMVLFPSWMPHSVQPVLGSSETRVSLAFNVAALRPASRGATWIDDYF